MKLNVWGMLNGCCEILFNLFVMNQLNSKYVSFSKQNLAFNIKCFVTATHYIVQVITLRSSTKLLLFTYALCGKIRNNQNCSSMLRSRRL